MYLFPKCIQCFSLNNVNPLLIDATVPVIYTDKMSFKESISFKRITHLMIRKLFIFCIVHHSYSTRMFWHKNTLTDSLISLSAVKQIFSSTYQLRFSFVAMHEFTAEPNAGVPAESVIVLIISHVAIAGCAIASPCSIWLLLLIGHAWYMYHKPVMVDAAIWCCFMDVFSCHWKWQLLI